jgi:DNA-binding LacI/PurR family transcriptional regulator
MTKKNSLGPPLIEKTDCTIGILVPNIENPFYVEIAKNIQQRGHELGLRVVICSTDNDSKMEIEYTSLLKQNSIDGLILAGGFENDMILNELANEGFPIVLVCQDIPSLLAESVSVDDFSSGYQVTKHLLSLGHHQIAIFAEKTRSSKERIRGYRKALEDVGLEFNESFVFVCDSTVKSGKQLAKQILGLIERPTAIFACNDLLAVGIFKGARERGIRVPDDLSIVGFDNTILATSIDPPLTSVKQPIEVMVREAINLLIQRIEGKKETIGRIVLLPEIIFRSSTKPPATKSISSFNIHGK